MHAYCLDLRERIIQTCAQAGSTRQEVAEIFGVSRSFVQKLLRRWQEAGSLTPRSGQRGPAPKLDEATCQRLRQRVQDCPDATLQELRTWLKESDGPSVSLATLCRALQTLHLPRKKSRCIHRSETRRGSSSCGEPGGGVSDAWTSSSWYLSMKAGRTRP